MTPATRKNLGDYGPKGRKVRVFIETGDKLVRVQWRQGGALTKKSWPNTAAGRSDAKAWAKEFAAVRDKLPTPSDADLTLRDLWERYALAELPHLRKVTIRNYRQHWAKWETFAGRHRHATTVSAELLDEFRHALATTKSTRTGRVGLAITQQRAAIAMVKQVFRWALQRELIARDRLSLYRFKVAKEQREKGVPEYTDTEYTLLLGAFDPRLLSQWRAWALVVLLGEQGPRVNAALHLRWDDIDLPPKPIVNPEDPTQVHYGHVIWRAGHDKLGRERVQPLTPASREALFVALGWTNAEAVSSGWVFYASWQDRKAAVDGTYTVQSFTWMLRAAEKRVGVQYIPRRGAHSLRRMAMGNALEVSKNVVDAMWWIGDTDLRQAKKYAKERDERMKGMAGMLGQRKRTNNAGGTDESLKKDAKQTVPQPSRVPERTSAPVEAEALSATTTETYK